jgi:hypothetical protein
LLAGAQVHTVRAYDDGIAFRYKLYRSEKIGARHITKELTTDAFLPQVIDLRL